MIWVLLLFALAGAAPLVDRLLGRRAGAALALVPLGICVAYAARIPEIAAHGELLWSIPLVPELGVALAERLDGLSLLLALLITGIGALVVLYAGAYFPEARGGRRGRFFALLIAFMAAMLGLVLADDLVVLYVFWELTSVTSFLLIGFDHESANARRAAQQALLVTVAGGLALMAAALLLQHMGGTFLISELSLQRTAIMSHPLYPLLLSLIILAAFTKSAQFPFHFWLPDAMVAPAPVSAYLHSATMVNAGVYLLARCARVVGGSPEWVWALTVGGVVTMLLGAVMALTTTDLKRMLAYGTVMALGVLTALLGLSFGESVKAMALFLLVHSLYKGGLFLVAGSLDHEAGSRDVLALGGLARRMPLSFAAALLACLSMAGLPPLLGFIGKELTFEAKLGVPFGHVLLPALAVVAMGLTVTVAAIVALRPFLGPVRAPDPDAHEAPVSMWLGPVVLGAAGLVLSLEPSLLTRPLVSAAMHAIIGAPPDRLELSPWPHDSPALLLSGLSWTLGVVVYLFWRRLRPPLATLAAHAARAGPGRGFRSALRWTLRAGELLSGALLRGGLPSYVRWTLGVFVALTGGVALVTGAMAAPSFAGTSATVWALAALVALSAVGAASTPSALVSVTLVAAAGFGIAALFALSGAPDVAITQLLVETLLTVTLLLVAARVPAIARRADPRPAPRRLRDLALSLSSGLVVVVVLLAVVSRPFDSAVAEAYADLAVPRGHGHNIVNVILVDFRALDTLGEITVIAVAAMGVLVLLRRDRRRQP